MVRKVCQNAKILYACEVCGLLYKERYWAERCQNFCVKLNACSLEITSHAIKVVKMHARNFEVGQLNGHF